MKFRDIDFVENFDLKLKHTIHKFNAEERNFLRKQGTWFWGLMCGSASPIVSDDEHFVKVSRGETDPVSEREHLWTRYLSARKEEEEIETSQIEEAKNSIKYRHHRSRISAP